jgi:hypothetical protein
MRDLRRPLVHLAEDRIIPRFHLEGNTAGHRVSLIKVDPGTGERLGQLPTGTVGAANHRYRKDELP